MISATNRFNLLALDARPGSADCSEASEKSISPEHPAVSGPGASPTSSQPSLFQAGSTATANPSLLSETVPSFRLVPSTVTPVDPALLRPVSNNILLARYTENQPTKSNQQAWLTTDDRLSPPSDSHSQAGIVNSSAMEPPRISRQTDSYGSPSTLSYGPRRASPAKNYTNFRLQGLECNDSPFYEVDTSDLITEAVREATCAGASVSSAAFNHAHGKVSPFGLRRSRSALVASIRSATERRRNDKTKSHVASPFLPPRSPAPSLASNHGPIGSPSRVGKTTSSATSSVSPTLELSSSANSDISDHFNLSPDSLATQDMIQQQQYRLSRLQLQSSQSDWGLATARATPEYLISQSLFDKLYRMPQLYDQKYHPEPDAKPAVLPARPKTSVAMFSPLRQSATLKSDEGMQTTPSKRDNHRRSSSLASISSPIRDLFSSA